MPRRAGTIRAPGAPAKAAAAALIAATALSVGCATTPGAGPAAGANERVTPSTSPQSFTELAVRFTDRALAQVRAGDLARAIDSWRVVVALRPDAGEPKRQIEDLTQRLAADAERRKAEAGTRKAPPPPPEPPLTAEEAEAQLSEAGELFAAGVFEAAAATAERLAGHATVGTRARRFAADAWIAAGDTALRQDRLPDALAAYRKAEPARPEAAALAASVERVARERAEEHYNEGVRHFVDEDLDAAIRSWERALALNPSHPNASRDIEKARELLRKLREIN